MKISPLRFFNFLSGILLRHPPRKHQDWFDKNDDEIQRLLEEKCYRLHKAYQNYISSVAKNEDYSNICKTVQTKLRDIQDSWLRKKQKFFSLLRTERNFMMH